MIKYSSLPYGKYTSTVIDNGYYIIADKQTGRGFPNKKTIFFSLLYNQIKDTLSKNPFTFLPFLTDVDIEFARFCVVVMSKSSKTYVIDMGMAVNNYTGGDVSMVTESINILNMSSCVCAIFICEPYSGMGGSTISTLNYNYKKIKKKLIILANPSSKIYQANEYRAPSVLLNPASIKRILTDDHTIITESVNDVGFLDGMGYGDFVYWTSLENFINRGYPSVLLKRNIYGIANTVAQVQTVLGDSRYKIQFDPMNIGLLNCGVAGSGKSFLGELLSKIPGVVTLRIFTKQAVDRIIKHNTLWSPDETSMYLFYLDEVDTMFFNPSSLSMFKAATGRSDFPGNIFVYATSNMSISLFDKSLYRTGRLQYQYWEYLTKADVGADVRWLNVISSGARIRYVDYIVRGYSFLDDILKNTQAVYDMGIPGISIVENQTHNRSNATMFEVQSMYKLQRIPNLTQLEHMSIRYKIDPASDPTRGWYMKAVDIGDMNVYLLDFYVFVTH